MNPLSALYGALAHARRTRYTRHPRLRRRLHRPVISVGNLVVGGSGKTPVVAALAQMLTAAGERPAVLSRGYARRQSSPSPIVVSDTSRVLESVDRSGDEPQMLARALPGVPVIVSADRYAAGLVAEQRFNASVLLLDDGFQHLALARDVDLLLMSADDLDAGVLPVGRLREPLSAAAAADAVIVRGSEEDARRVSAAVGVSQVFRLGASYGPLRLVAPYGQLLAEGRGRVVAVAAIARPDRFFDVVRAQGFDIAREWTFRDHHWFTAGDVERIAESMRTSGADLVITTEKDAVRLEPLVQSLADRSAAREAGWAFLPLRASIEPAAAFRSWLAARLAAARAEERQA